MTDDRDPIPESQLPYEAWTEDVLRQVVARAVAYAAANGFPGGHHFYLTFRTDHPGVVIPPRLRSQYPHEMTIVLQHQYWDLKMDEAAGLITVGLSFGGTPAALAIPLAAMTGFADPHVRYGLRFHVGGLPQVPEEEQEAPLEAAPAEAQAPEAAPQVVSLDAFRRKTPPKT